MEAALSNDPDTTVPDSFLHILSVSNIPVLITGATALLVCVSAVYMTAYFYIVGSQFQGFLSPSDYIVGSINWLPTMFFAYGYVTVSRVTYSLLGDRFKQPGDGFKQKKIIVIWLAANILFLVARLSTDHSGQIPAILSLLILLNIAILSPFIIFNGLDGIIPKKFLHPIVVSIILIGYVAVRGISDAVHNIDIDNDPSATIYQISLPNKDLKTIFPLMNIDKGLIYKEKGGIHFTKLADISEFSRLNVENSNSSLPCELFANLLKYFCQE